MKKRISILLIFTLFITSTKPVFSINYSENEDYWYSVCNGRISPEMLSSCQGFNAYLKNKADNMQSQLSELDSQIQAIKGDIDELVKVANDLQAQIDVKNSEIQEFENQIAALENTIVEVEAEIIKKEEDIEIRDQQIKERMVQSQTYNNAFGYIDFLMGASDFIDLIQRISIMNQITSHEEMEIEAFTADIQQLEIDHQQITIQKESLETQKNVLNQAKIELEGYKQRQDALIAEYKMKEEELMDAYMRSEASINSIRDNMPSFSVSGGQPSDTNGFGPVVSGYLSAGTWYYPASFGGGRHSGMDIAGPIGTPITAPFNGIVAIAQNLTSQGGLGTRPFTGNNVMLIGTVNGTTYAIHMLHMQYNSITVSPGQNVTKGQVIGARGSTGNSTGPHVHIDLYNLGTMSVEDAYNQVRNTGTYTFGMNYHAYGWECSNKAPICRERPEELIPY